jgi:hypothetical protein
VTWGDHDDRKYWTTRLIAKSKPVGEIQEEEQVRRFQYCGYSAKQMTSAL